MSELDVDANDPTWRAVCAHVRRRIDELAASAVVLEASDRDRDRAAARVAELRMLLIAPERAKSVALSTRANQGATY